MAATDSVKSTDVAEMEVKKSPFTNYVQIQGSIDAQDNVIAYPQNSAVITAIYVKVGDHVSKGQTLVQLDNSVQRQNIAQAETEAELTMNRTLYKASKKSLGSKDWYRSTIPPGAGYSSGF